MAKSLIRSMGADKTENAISVRSKAVSGTRDILQAFDTCSKAKAKSTKHSRPSSYEDEVELIADLQKLKPFRFVQGRRHPSFPNISASPQSALDIEKFNQWI